MSPEIYKPENPNYEEFDFSQALEKSQEIIGKDARIELVDGSQFGIYPIDSIQDDCIFLKTDHRSEAVKYHIAKDQIEKVIVKS